MQQSTRYSPRLLISCSVTPNPRAGFYLTVRITLKPITARSALNLALLGEGSRRGSSFRTWMLRAGTPIFLRHRLLRSFRSWLLHASLHSGWLRCLGQRSPTCPVFPAPTQRGQFVRMPRRPQFGLSALDLFADFDVIQLEAAWFIKASGWIARPFLSRRFRSSDKDFAASLPF